MVTSMCLCVNHVRVQVMDLSSSSKRKSVMDSPIAVKQESPDSNSILSNKVSHACLITKGRCRTQACCRSVPDFRRRMAV